MRVNRKMLFILVIMSFIIFVGCSSEDDNEIMLDNDIESYEQRETAVGKEDASDDANEKNSGAEVSEKSEGLIYVYVTGCVNKPDVYAVTNGSRLFEVIELAGGFTQKAQTDYLNLAQKVSDGQQICVMSKKECESAKSQGGFCENTDAAAGGDAGQPADGESGLVDINTATEEQLMTLRGIGQSKARAIISYREDNGRFNSIEDIMLVPGIKEASFTQIKDFIKV